MKSPQTIEERDLLLGDNKNGDRAVVDMFRLARGGFYPVTGLWEEWDDEWNEPVGGLPLAAFVFRWARESRESLLLFGKVGTGKTHLAKLTGAYMTMGSTCPLFLDWPAYVEDCQKQRRNPIDLTAYDFVVLDDVGADRVSSYTLKLLETILNNGRVRFLVTMNMAPERWEAALLQGGSEVKSDSPELFRQQVQRCADRLMAGAGGRFAAHIEVRSSGSRRRM